MTFWSKSLYQEIEFANLFSLYHEYYIISINQTIFLLGQYETQTFFIGLLYLSKLNSNHYAKHSIIQDIISYFLTSCHANILCD